MVAEERRSAADRALAGVPGDVAGEERQGVEEEVAQLVDGLMGDVHRRQGRVDAEDVGAELDIF